MKKIINYFLFLFIVLPVLILLVGYLVPEQAMIPVDYATPKDWNKNSFWQHPWGESGTHKGIDIFAPWGTTVRASTSGFVVFSGDLRLGGLAISILGPKWKTHYYAHLRERLVSQYEWVNKGQIIGYVGTTGNAVGKKPHLHYSIASLVPLPWRWDDSPQGWKKMFYLDPDKALR